MAGVARHRRRAAAAVAAVVGHPGSGVRGVPPSDRFPQHAARARKDGHARERPSPGRPWLGSGQAARRTIGLVPTGRSLAAAPVWVCLLGRRRPHQWWCTVAAVVRGRAAADADRGREHALDRPQGRPEADPERRSQAQEGASALPFRSVGRDQSDRTEQSMRRRPKLWTRRHGAAVLYENFTVGAKRFRGSLGTTKPAEAD